MPKPPTPSRLSNSNSPSRVPGGKALGVSVRNEGESEGMAGRAYQGRPWERPTKRRIRPALFVRYQPSQRPPTALPQLCDWRGFALGPNGFRATVVCESDLGVGGPDDDGRRGLADVRADRIGLGLGLVGSAVLGGVGVLQRAAAWPRRFPARAQRDALLPGGTSRSHLAQ